MLFVWLFVSVSISLDTKKWYATVVKWEYGEEFYSVLTQIPRENIVIFFQPEKINKLKQLRLLPTGV